MILGSTNISTLKLGSSAVQKVMLGATEVWSNFDADAAAYIAAVETALSSSITGDQKNAINTFFKTGKSDGWYSSIKRLYLPIWADPAANAIDMITRTSGTFSIGGVDHSNVGYVQGDGVNGYFDYVTPNNVLGITNSNGSIFVLRTNVVKVKFITGTIASGFRRIYIVGGAGGVNGQWITASGPYSGPSDSDANGIVLVSRASGATTTSFRNSSGISNNVSTYANIGTTATTSMHVMGLNGSTTSRDSSRYGAFGVGDTISDASGFTLALKDLWETASGLALP